MMKRRMGVYDVARTDLSFWTLGASKDSIALVFG